MTEADDSSTLSDHWGVTVVVDYATLQNLDIAALVPVQFIYIPLGRLTVIPAGYKTYFTLLSLFLHVNYTVYKEVDFRKYIFWTYSFTWLKWNPLFRSWALNKIAD